MKKVFSLIRFAAVLTFFCLSTWLTNAQIISMQANGSGGTSMAVCSDGNVVMWGSNSLGQEGIKFGTSSGNSPVLVLSGDDSAACGTHLCRIKVVAAGDDYNSYALDSAGHVWSWGYCQFSNLGNGTDGVIGCAQDTPVEVKTAPNTPLTNIITITAGFNDAFAIDSSHNLWCWGFNGQYGDLGVNTTNDIPYAVQVHGVGNAGFLTGVTAVAAGYSHSIAVGPSGKVYGWGLNNCGQDGSGYPTNWFYPVNVYTSAGYLTNCIAVAAGGETSYALDDSGHVWSWGLDVDGEGGVNHSDNAPGDGGGSANNLAVQVGSGGCGGGVLNNIVAIASGGTNAYALDNKGHVWAWGLNANGECGNGNQNSQPCPVEVLTGPGTPLDSIVAIAGGPNQAMALSSGGVIYTWGYNSGGQLGNVAISATSLYAMPMTPGYCNITPCPASALNVSATQLLVCQGDSLTLSASGATTYIWNPASRLTCPGCSSTAAYPDSTTTFTITGYNGACSLTDSITITVKQSPPPPVITQHNDTLIFNTDTAYASYQWYADTILIQGATDSSLIIFNPGNYNVQITGADGCKIAAGIVVLGLKNYMNDHVISLWPDPVKDKFRVYGLPFTVGRIDIYNTLGQVVERTPLLWRGVGGEADVSSLPSGIYFVQLVGEKERWKGKFVKE